MTPAKPVLSAVLMVLAVGAQAQWSVDFPTQAQCTAAVAAGGKAPTCGVNVRAFGAVCDGVTDDGTAIAKAAADAKLRAVPVLIPAGVCAYGDVITIDGVKIQGVGAASALFALNPVRAALILTGTGSEVRSLRMSGKATARSTARESSRIVPLGASAWVIDSVLIDNAAGAGIHAAQQATGGTISANRITGTLADAIHLTGRANYITVTNNTITNSGDDGVAVVSYQGDGGLTHHVTARGNTITDMRGGRNMSVVGGADVLYENNRLTNNTQAACLYVSQESAYTTYGIRSVIAQFNTLTNCGNAQKGHTAIMLFSDGQLPNTLATLYRNEIVGGPTGGIRVFGPQTLIAVESNKISGTEPPLNIKTPGVTVIPYTSGPAGVQ